MVKNMCYLKANNSLPAIQNLIYTINYPYEIDGGIKKELLYEENKLMKIFRNESEAISNFE